MTILLTGATGFIGSHVARQLVSEGQAVLAAVRPGSDRRRIEDISSALDFVNLDEPDLAGPPPELCIHLAWYAEPGRYLDAPENLDALSSSLRLAQRMARCGCKRLVAAGTCLEYDADLGGLSESSPTRPRHLYSASKLALFLTLEQYCRTVGMQFAWMRLFYLYGPFEDPRRLVPSVINALRHGQPAELSPGTQERDPLHVEDVAAAVCTVAHSTLAGPVNIGAGQAVTVAEIAQTVGRLMGKPELVRLGAQPSPLDEPRRLVADTTRLRQETGWLPRFDLETGLQRTIDWWKRQP